jgi:flagellar hook assembly protein FlgD
MAGNHEFVWNGDDNNKKSVASGVYLYRLETNGQSAVKKMLLMK